DVDPDHPTRCAWRTRCLRTNAGYRLARVLSRVERQETASAGTWTMGFYATARHARTLGRRRFHELLRPPDVETRRSVGRQAVSKRGSADDRPYRECTGKPFDEC